MINRKNKNRSMPEKRKLIMEMLVDADLTSQRI